MASAFFKVVVASTVFSGRLLQRRLFLLPLGVEWTGVQLSVAPDQRSGVQLRTAHGGEPAPCNTRPDDALPASRSVMRLCRCSWLYQRMKSLPQLSAASRSAKPCFGHCGQYFSVRNSDSEYVLSSLTRGRLRDDVTPRSYIFSSMVTDFIGAPLSEYSTSGLSRHC